MAMRNCSVSAHNASCACMAEQSTHISWLFNLQKRQARRSDRDRSQGTGFQLAQSEEMQAWGRLRLLSVS